MENCVNLGTPRCVNEMKQSIFNTSVTKSTTVSHHQVMSQKHPHLRRQQNAQNDQSHQNQFNIDDQETSVYFSSILSYILQRESQYKCLYKQLTLNSIYFSQQPTQEKLFQRRSSLSFRGKSLPFNFKKCIEFMVHITVEYAEDANTIFSACTLFNLALRQKINLDHEVVCVTALFMASKFHSSSPYDLELLAEYYSDRISPKDILLMEEFIFNCLLLPYNILSFDTQAKILSNFLLTLQFSKENMLQESCLFLLQCGLFVEELYGVQNSVKVVTVLTMIQEYHQGSIRKEIELLQNMVHLQIDRYQQVKKMYMTSLMALKKRGFTGLQDKYCSNNIAEILNSYSS